MIKTKKVQIEREELVSKQCDRCSKQYDQETQMMGCQEFHHICFTGGYGSIFGDRNEVKCDLCQDCLYVMIKDYMRVKEQYE